MAVCVRHRSVFRPSLKRVAWPALGVVPQALCRCSIAPSLPCMSYTIAVSDRMILACAPDDAPAELARRLETVLPGDMGVRAHIESQLVTVTGVTLFPDDVAAFQAGAIDLWHARPGALNGFADADGRQVTVAARLGGRKP